LFGQIRDSVRLPENVKGPNLMALHELFHKFNDEVKEAVDQIAERADWKVRGHTL
jgi:DNA-binding ferritin-like protein